MPAIPVSVPLDCRYLLETGGEDAWAFVVLHGFGQSAAEMLRLVRPMAGEEDTIAAIQAPHPYPLRPFSTQQDTGYHWGAPGADWDAAIALHHRLVSAVLDDLRQRTGLRAERTILAGFSQPVGMNYRFVESNPERVRGVIGICGGVPKAWEQATLRPIDAALLHIARTDDEFYAVDRLPGFEQILRSAAADVEFHLIPGKHRFPSTARAIVEPWLARLATPKR